jgi:hypothetical protein
MGLLFMPRINLLHKNFEKKDHPGHLDFYRGWGGIIILSPVLTFFTTRFNIHKLYGPPTKSIYVFCVDLRTTNSDYFPILQLSVNTFLPNDPRFPKEHRFS